jgi:hypothetical protein
MAVIDGGRGLAGVGSVRLAAAISPTRLAGDPPCDGSPFIGRRQGSSRYYS